LTLPDGGNYSDVLLVTGKMTTIQGPHSILGVTLTLEEYFEQFWLGDYPLPIMENYYVISTSPTGTKKLEFKRTLFLSKNSMNTLKNSSSGVLIYPNPANNIVNLSGKTDLVLIYDSKGALVSKFTEKDHFNISSFENGFYTITLYNGERFSTHKLIKQ
jgi:hypothetical protein